MFDSNQSDLMFENGIKSDDFCFIEQIKEEFESRVKSTLVKNRKKCWIYVFTINLIHVYLYHLIH